MVKSSNATIPQVLVDATDSDRKPPMIFTVCMLVIVATLFILTIIAATSIFRFSGQTWSLVFMILVWCLVVFVVIAGIYYYLKNYR